MAHAIWTGAINFGLVTIPVKLQTAIRTNDLRFNFLHKKDEGRINNGPVICACFGVRFAAIRDALETGIAADVADIGRILRAGTNCGSCVPELRGIIEKAAQPV